MCFLGGADNLVRRGRGWMGVYSRAVDGVVEYGHLLVKGGVVRKWTYVV